MTETDQLARLRDEVPRGPVSARAETTFLAGLHDTDSERVSRLAPRPRPAHRFRGTLHAPRAWTGRPSRARWRAAAVAAVAGAAAAAVAVSLAVSPAAPMSRATHDSTGATLTVKVLAARAAQAAAAGPDVSPQQWVYTKSLWVDSLGRQITDGWATAALTKWVGGYSSNRSWGGNAIPVRVSKTGKLSFAPVTISYRALIRLPDDPAAIVRVLNRYTSPAYPGTEGPRVFEQISDILTYYVPPPRVTADLYRALALLPGVRVVRDATDVAGRHGTGFAEYQGNGVTQEIMLSPSSYRFMGMVSGSPHTARTGWAILKQQFVSKPGIRP